MILDNCEHVLDAAAALAVRLLDAAPGLRILCTSQVPLDVDGEAVVRARAARRSPTPSSCSPVAPRAQRLTRRLERERRRGARPVPLARRSAAGDRARRGPHQDAVDRGDHPPPRRSVHRAERPDQPQPGTPPLAQVDDPVELRPVVPRRPARALGAGHLRRRRAPAGGRVRPRSARRAGGRGDRRGRPARQPVAGDRRRRRRRPRAARSATGCSTASGRSRSRRWPTPGCPSAPSPRTPPGSPTRPHRSTAGVRSSRQAEHLAFARAERANIDAALAWSGAARPAARAATSSTGSAGPGSCSATAEAHSGSWPRSTRPATRRRPGPGRRPAARGVDRGVDRPPRARPATTSPRPPSWPTRSTTSTCRRAAAYYLAYVVSHHGEFRQALELTDRSRALYDGLDRPWDQAANWLFAARAAISAGDQERSVEAADQVQHWLRHGRRPVAARPRRGDARRAGPRSSTGSTTPSCTSAAPPRRRAGSASCRPRPTR